MAGPRDSFAVLVVDILDLVQKYYCDTLGNNIIVHHVDDSINAMPVHFDPPLEPPKSYRANCT